MFTPHDAQGGGKRIPKLTKDLKKNNWLHHSALKLSPKIMGIKRHSSPNNLWRKSSIHFGAKPLQKTPPKFNSFNMVHLNMTEKKNILFFLIPGFSICVKVNVLNAPLLQTSGVNISMSPPKKADGFEVLEVHLGEGETQRWGCWFRRAVFLGPRNGPNQRPNTWGCGVVVVGDVVNVLKFGKQNFRAGFVNVGKNNNTRIYSRFGANNTIHHICNIL